MNLEIKKTPGKLLEVFLINSVLHLSAYLY